MENEFKEQKERLIKYWTDYAIITNNKVIDAFRKVKRENFMTEEYRKYAYVDNAFPTLAGQTISQPSTVMLMTQDLGPEKGNKVLEIGAGSGYQAAIIAEMVKPGIVYSVEIIPELYEFAKNNLKVYKNVKVFLSDGSVGLKKYSPYDRIIITAACSEKPSQLFKQLKTNGILIVPIGDKYMQVMHKFTKLKDKIEEEILGEYVFVPLKGKYGFKA
ncbi:protein-L-isoaspartate(D-aspartate) O-methyltransferase [Candidatus Woesearchaeota archaeon]|nr:protein-L-isoaspartate(D-aspartate) O-methyltransferase [Candidatus Woesearchaeota archaeon]